MSNFAVQFVLARTLGPSQFGAFSAALATVTLVAPLAAFGVGGWWLKVFGEKGYEAMHWVKPSLQFSVLSSYAVILLLVTWANLGPHDNLTGVLIVMLTGVVLAQVTIDLVSAKFQLEARYIGLAVWQLVSHPVRLAGILLLVLHLPVLTVFHVASLYLVVSVLVLSIGSLYLARFYDGNFRLAGHKESKHILKTRAHLEKSPLKSVFISAFPFGLQSFLFLFYYQVDVILLRYLVNEEAVGFYGASVIFMSAVYILPSVLYQKMLLPRIHCWAYEEGNRLQVFVKKGGVLLFFVGILITLLIWFVAPFFVPLILGEEYYPSVSLLMLMSLAIPFRYLAVHLASVLCTSGLMWVNLRITAFTALFCVLLNFILIPQYGGVGAAIAMVVSDISLAVFFSSAVRKNF